MSALWDLLVKGGPVMIPIVGLSIVLYARCLNLLLVLVQVEGRLRRDSTCMNVSRVAIRALQVDLTEMFRGQRLVIGVMLAAAPLLGLLGTVMGMIQTFDSIARRAGERSMEGLASGISQALITTETGLAVAIPAVLVVYYAYRRLQRVQQQLVRWEIRLAGSG